MSEVDVSEVRGFLRVIHTADDTLLGVLISAAEAEAKRFMNRRQLPTEPYDTPVDSEGDLTSEDEPNSDTDPICADCRLAIYLLVQARYEGTKPDDQITLRKAAETLLMPYRVSMGV